MSKNIPYVELGKTPQEGNLSNWNHVLCFNNCSVKRSLYIFIFLFISLVLYFKIFLDSSILNIHCAITNGAFGNVKLLLNKMASDENKMEETYSLISTISLDEVNNASVKNAVTLPPIEFCPLVPPGLVGPVNLLLNEISLEDVEKNSEMKLLDLGGHFAPQHCKPNNRVAIIIPYRNRESHLSKFLNNIHKFLMKQEIEYQIYIIEQMGEDKFNRASLLNIGYVEALRDKPIWDCFIFHDVDKLPMDDRNLYTCSPQPRHFSAAIDIFDYKLPYRQFFGGVTGISTEQFKTVNGFSNRFWGWGAEDDDFYNRVVYYNLKILRYSKEITKYKSFDHDRPLSNPNGRIKLNEGKKIMKTEGLNNLQYRVNKTTMHRMYTNFLVEIQNKE